MNHAQSAMRLCIYLLLFMVSPCVNAADRPNFVWIMSEDNSTSYLRHFDTNGAPAPHIEALAEHGITFDRAFSCAPVCSVARTTLITSCYAPRIGTQYHRRSKMAAMPSGLKMFPAYLRQAGYYTTNNSKEDYNATKSDDVWDASSKKASWKNRPEPSTPFFHVVTTTLSHESSLHFPETTLKESTKTDPSQVSLPPYFPDTEVFRYTLARYHDRIMAVDNVVGKIVEELTQAGELENTFLFYFGDHGGVLPRSKGYLFESGLRVPLVVRVPEKWKGSVARELGSRTDGFVEFVDFGPTVLKLAEVEIPSGIDGNPFLGKGTDAKEVDGRNETFGYADRFDEKTDLVRSLRIGDLKYIRNFEPYYPDGLQNNYRYKMLAYQQWRDLHNEGKLNKVQDQFFVPKTVEALYDLQSDPHEVHNLASDPKFSKTLAQIRARLNERLKAMPDLSFATEAGLYNMAMDNPVAAGQKHREGIGRLIDIANLSLLPFAEAEPKLRQAIESKSPWEQYWGLIAACCFGPDAAPLSDTVKPLLEKAQPLVVMRAAEFMALATDDDPRPALYRAISGCSIEPEALRVLNSAVFLHDGFGDRLRINASEINLPEALMDKRDVTNRVEYLGR
ncbi:sulfatase [Novipirellula herctigrandis]